MAINDNVFLNAYGGIEIGNNSGIAYGTALISEDHEIGDTAIPIREQGKVGGKITLEDNVWVASNCVILRGITIGTGSVVAAGSVVTRSIPPYSIVGGNPARVLRKRKRPGEDKAPPTPDPKAT